MLKGKEELAGHHLLGRYSPEILLRIGGCALCLGSILHV